MCAKKPGADAVVTSTTMPWLRRILVALSLVSMVAACKPKKPPAPKVPATAEGTIDETATFELDADDLDDHAFEDERDLQDDDDDGDAR